MNIFYIITFLVGTGFGWCLCSLVDIFRKYLEMKRDQKKSERTWAELRPYLEHCLGHNDEGGLAWLSYDELRERRKKQNENMGMGAVGTSKHNQGIEYAHQSAGVLSENSSTT